MELTSKNYYDVDIDNEYMSVHQYLDFIGSLGVEGCESRAMAKLRGDYKPDTTDAMLVGSYVDAYFEGTLDEFKKNNPQIFTQKGELYAKYRQADVMIKRCEEDELFMQFMSGEKQKIFTADMFGCKWKCKLDSYIPHTAITDLKTTANMHKSWNVRDYGRVSFVEYFGYITQLAVYQEIVYLNTGERLPCYITAVTKEEVPEIEIITFDQESLNHALNSVEMNMPSILSLKNGEYEPTECGRCEWCKKNKKLKEAISYLDLIWES